MEKVNYHPLLQLYANTYGIIIAAILGWRLIQKEELINLLSVRGGNDRVKLASEVLKKEGKTITFSLSKSLGLLASGDYDHNKILSTIAQLTLGHCYEILKENSLIPNSSKPVLEFYRHIRNASFHGNRIHLIGQEPKYLAGWRGIKIDNSMQGKRVFRPNLQENDYLLNWGDVSLFLEDVSKEIS